MPPEILGILIPALAFSGIVAMLVAGAVKVAQTIAGRGTSASELEELKHRLEDAEAALAEQSSQLAELQERVDFADRRLTSGPGEAR